MNLTNPRLHFTQKLTPLNLNVIDGIVFHHIDHETAEIGDIHDWHLKRGWAGCGYNFFGDKQGRAFIGRGWREGAHARGHNSTKIGVAFQGAFESNNSMTDAQVQFGIDITRHIFDILGRKVPIYVHSDVGVTLCAGRHFRLNEIKAGLKEPIRNERVNNVILRNGSRGDNVRQLQRDLLQLGYSLPRFGADGHFGVETEAAVRQFQRDQKLTVDGIAGPQTLGRIEALLAAESELYRVQVGAFSNRQNALNMERRLKDAGFDTFIVKG